MIEKEPGDLISGCLFITHGMKSVIVKTEYLAVRKTQEDRRMSGYDELAVVIDTVHYFCEQSQLALRR